jgi:hypothetical protein
MMSHYFVALGSLPQHLPQHKAAGEKKKACFLGPIQAHPRLRSWEVPLPESCPERLTDSRKILL